MLIIPVLDILGRQVVRGIAGERQNYRPIVSPLTKSTDPRDVATAIRDQFGLSRFYVADLDAIAGNAPDFDIYDRLQNAGFDLSVDAGLRSIEQARTLQKSSVAGIIAALETLPELFTLEELVKVVGPDRLTFSLDLKGGVPVASTGWDGQRPAKIAEQAVGVGVQRMIVLDIAQVGTNSGNASEDLCAELIQTYPDLEIITGGGVRGLADLQRLQRCGVKGVLIASALHDGRLTPEDLAGLMIGDPE